MTDTARILCTAKITCTAKGPAGEGQKRLGFSADYANGANAEWAKWTPVFSQTMVVLDPVAERFEVGQHITLLFTEQDAEAFAHLPGGVG